MAVTFDEVVPLVLLAQRALFSQTRTAAPGESLKHQSRVRAHINGILPFLHLTQFPVTPNTFYLAILVTLAVLLCI